MVKYEYTTSGPAEEEADIPECVENGADERECESVGCSIADFIRSRFDEEGLIFDHSRPAIVKDCEEEDSQAYRMTVQDALRWAEQWTFKWHSPWCFIQIPAANGVFVLHPDNEEYSYECICINTERLPTGSWSATGQLIERSTFAAEVTSPLKPE